MSMTLVQFLLNKVAEEANEVAIRALKAAQFGLEEVQPGQDLNNRLRLRAELQDLYAILILLERVDLGTVYGAYHPEQISAKIEKVRTYLKLSQYLGKVEDAKLA